MDRYIKTMDIVYRLCIWIAGISIIIMTIVIPWGIYARKVLGSGSGWPEPVAIICMVVFTFFGAAASYRAGGHIAVDMFVSRIPPRAQRFLAQIVNILMILISLFIVIWGSALCKVTWNQTLDALPWLRVGITYLPLPLGSAMIILFIIENMLAGSQKNRPIVIYDQEKTVETQGGQQ